MIIKPGNHKYNILSSITLLFRNNPVSCTFFLVFGLILAIGAPLDIILRENLLAAVMSGLRTGNGFQKALPFLAGTLLLFLLTRQQPVINSLLKSRIIANCLPLVREKIIERIASLKYSFMEHQETRQMINRVEEKLEVNLTSGFEGGIQILMLAFRISGTLMIVMAAAWWFGPIILLLLLLTTVVSVYSGRVITRGWIASSSQLMRWIYMYSLSQDRDTAPERKLFDTTEFIKNRWFTSATEYNDITGKSVLGIEKFHIPIKIIIYAVQFTSLFLFLLPLVDGKITIEYYLAISFGIIALQNYLNREAGQIIKNLTETKLYWKEVRSLFALEENPDYLLAPAQGKPFTSLEFRDVWFRYPYTEVDILKGVSFKIEKGEHCALVGENGSGKSTIIKLICGFYTPDKGSILINNKNIKEYSPPQLKGLFTVVFQDFARYFITFKDNVLFGDNSPENLAKMNKILDRAGLRTTEEELPQGYESVLGKISDKGVGLSGGQWQRLAFARGLYPDTRVKIFDEPTAALDPISESELYEQYDTLLANTTSIFISHRLGSTKLAGKIIVLKDGVIVETGSHAELMANHGMYAEIFTLQSQLYDKRSWIYDK